MIRISLITLNGKMSEMFSIVVQNNAFLDKVKIFATITTGSHLERQGFEVDKLQMLTSLFVVDNIPLATNPKSGYYISKGIRHSEF
jgi:methylglyoxal synthase